MTGFGIGFPISYTSMIYFGENWKNAGLGLFATGS